VLEAMQKQLSILLSIGAAALLQGFVAQASLASGEQPISKKYQIISGYLLHFTSFVRWPDLPAKQSIGICIYGADPFGDFLDEMIKVRPLNREGMKIVTLRIGAGGEFSDCSLVFVSKNSITDEFWSSVPENHSLLLVSDDPEFTRKGGIVSFYEENKRLRIEINLVESRKSELDISSELLKVVRITNNQMSESSQ
jgi:hypothetical protein